MPCRLDHLLTAAPIRCARCCPPAASPGRLARRRANVIELGGLLAGESEVPRGGSTSTGASCTFFKSVGTAIQDVATAAAVLKQARSKGIGKRVSF